MPDKDAEAWIRALEGRYRFTGWGGSPTDSILQNDPAFLRFHNTLKARNPEASLSLVLKPPDEKNLIGTMAIGDGTPYQIELRAPTDRGVSGLIDDGHGAMKFSVDGGRGRLRFTFWSAKTPDQPLYYDVIRCQFQREHRDAGTLDTEQVFLDRKSRFTFRYPEGWKVEKNRLGLRLMPDWDFGDQFIQIVTVEAGGSQHPDSPGILEQLEQLMVESQPGLGQPERVGEIGPAEAFGKIGVLINWDRVRTGENASPIRVFAVMHEGAAIALWATGTATHVAKRDADVKERDELLRKIFATFSGGRPKPSVRRRQPAPAGSEPRTEEPKAQPRIRYRLCGVCGGLGKVRCSSCGGSGYHTRSGTRTRWDNSVEYYQEQVPCSSCVGGRTMCMRCSGVGQVPE
ncbi:MAG: hypothetical protein HY660_06245 [Armatimonadetes bacterium]|nr:hypothetical protein [Armatimonadota bacterium]